MGDIAESLAAFFRGVDAADDCAQGNFAGFGKGPEAGVLVEKKRGGSCRAGGDERRQQSVQRMGGKNNVIIEDKDVGDVRIFQGFGRGGIPRGAGSVVHRPRQPSNAGNCLADRACFG